MEIEFLEYLQGLQIIVLPKPRQTRCQQKAREKPILVLLGIPGINEKLYEQANQRHSKIPIEQVPLVQDINHRDLQAADLRLLIHEVALHRHRVA